MKKRYSLLIFSALLIGCCSFPVFAAEDVRIERTTASGMSIILQKDPSDVAKIVLLLKSGSGLEPSDKKGVAQIMNNIVYWILQSDDRDSVGSVDVETNPDYTLINFTTLAKNIKPALARIKFLLSEPIYSYDDVVDLQKYSRTRVKSQIGLVLPYIQFNKEFYGTGHPYNDWPTPDSLSAITGPDVYQWYRQTYQPGNAILSISGKIHQNISDLARFFTDMQNETVDHRLTIKPVLLTASQQIEQEDKNSKAASICIGYPAPRIQDPDYPAFRLITFYLSDYFEYFDELRLKYGLLYTPMVFSNELEKPNAPNLVLLSMTDPDHVKMLETETFKLMGRLMSEGIPQDEISRILKAMKAADEAKEASGENIALQNALSYYLQSQLVYTKSLWPKLEQIKTEDIKRVAGKYFKNYIQVVWTPKQIAADL
jgi:predicted Zn-dependent peptidase